VNSRFVIVLQQVYYTKSIYNYLDSDSEEELSSLDSDDFEDDDDSDEDEDDESEDDDEDDESEDDDEDDESEDDDEDDDEESLELLLSTLSLLLRFLRSFKFSLIADLYSRIKFPSCFSPGGKSRWKTVFS
jgi:hypothetical protein